MSGSVDVSIALREWLATDERLDCLLGFDTCEDARDVHIHKDYAPQQDAVFDLFEKMSSDPSYNCRSDLRQLHAYVWYEQRDETGSECIGGDCDKRPVTVEFDFEVVAFRPQERNEIVRGLTDRLNELDVCPCDPIPCIKGVHFQRVAILSQSDDYEPTNALADGLGAFTRFFAVKVWPLWKN